MKFTIPLEIIEQKIYLSISHNIFAYIERWKAMQQKTVSIQESIRVEIYNELLDFGNGKLKDGIDNAVYLAHTMKVLQKSQMNEAIEIWRRIFNN
jgi:hypothetical protein